MLQHHQNRPVKAASCRQVLRPAICSWFLAWMGAVRKRGAWIGANAVRHYTYCRPARISHVPRGYYFLTHERLRHDLSVPLLALCNHE